jgi:hypothetical protein
LKRLAILVVIGLVMSLGTALAGSNSTTLPNGANLQVSIDDPVTSTEFLIPTGDPSRGVDVSGTASVGLGEPDATLVDVMDVSGSTDVGFGTGCAPILGCEQQFVTALNQAAVASGSVDEVGVAVFATSAATADMSPAGGDQVIVAPDADNFVNTVVNSTFSVFGGNGGVAQFTNKVVGVETNYTAGLQKALDVVNASSNSVNIVVFVSDGVSTEGAGGFAAAVAALAAAGAVVNSVALGSEASGGADINCSSGTGGTLQQMADGTGGTCFDIDDPGALPLIIPDLISTSLDSLEIEVDGGGANPIPNADISLPLPQPGAVSVNYTTTVPGLGPGDHKICVTATGSDPAGSASVTQCETIHLLQISLAPETATNELGTLAQTHTVTATVAGPASGPASVEGRTVNFHVVSGPNVSKAGSGTTDSAGQVSFTYTAEQGLAGLGTDTIQACVTLNSPLGETGCDEVTKDWVDTTPPVPACIETVNPAGKKVPPAGSTTLPGSKGGQNEDGFYQLLAKDNVDPNPKVFVVDTGSGTVFGPFASGTNIKYTEDPTATPSQTKMGSSTSAVTWHIIGKGDAAMYAVDASGNQSSPVSCLVPPPPK